jgi:hypothetical protein
MLLLRLSQVRVEFDLSASDNLLTPYLLMLFALLSENEMKATRVLHPRSRKVIEVLDLSASDNFMAPSSRILLPVLSENQMKQQVQTPYRKQCEGGI